MSKPSLNFPEDEETDRRLVLVILGVSLAATVVFMIADISRSFMLILILALIAAFVLALSGRLKFAGWIGPLAGLAVFTLLVFRNKGIRDTAMLGLPVTIVAGSLMNGRRGAVVFGLLSLLVVGALGAAEFTGRLPEDAAIRNTLADYGVIGITIIFTTIIQWAVVSRLSEKTRRANRELAERKQAEVKLRKSEVLHRRAIDAAGAVPYYRDFSTNTYTSMGEGILQMTGYSAAEMTPDLWESLELERVPRGRLAGLTYAEADRLVEASDDLVWECDYRIRTRDGQIRWVADTSIMGFGNSGEQTGVVGILQDITERKQTEQQIRQRLQELDAIHTVSLAASSELEWHALFDLVSHELFRLFDIHENYFALLDQQSGQVEFPYYRHEDQIIATEPVPFGQGLSSRVIMTRQPLLINQDYVRRSAELGVVRFSPAPTSLNQVSWLGVPIQVGEQVIGMVCVMNLARENAFSDDDVRLLTTITASVGIAIRNAQLFKAVGQELADRRLAEHNAAQTAEQLAMLNRIGQAVSAVTDLNAVLETVRLQLEKLVAFDAYSVRIFNEEERTVSHLAVFENGRYWPEPDHPLLAGTHIYRVFETGEPILHLLSDEEVEEYRRTPYQSIGDRAGMTTSLIFAPLKRQGRTIGALSVQRYQQNAYTPQDLHLVEAVAIQVTIAIENARLFSSLQQELAERRRAEALVRQLNEELEQRIQERTGELELANKELEAFSYSVSHDLRAPLRAINSFTGIIKSDFAAGMDPAGLAFIDKVLDAGRRMNSLIDDLLEFSRTGRRPLHKQNVDMLAVVRSVIESLGPELENRQIEWSISPLPPAEADPVLIQQVYVNLIGNAVKYSRNCSPARIEVSHQFVDGETVYLVRDNGAGFDMRYADKLFGVFQRLHRDVEFEGTGIGLATVKRIVARHGGRVWATGEPDKGATFYFTL